MNNCDKLLKGTWSMKDLNSSHACRAQNIQGDLEISFSQKKISVRVY